MKYIWARSHPGKGPVVAAAWLGPPAARAWEGKAAEKSATFGCAWLRIRGWWEGCTAPPGSLWSKCVEERGRGDPESAGPGPVPEQGEVQQGDFLPRLPHGPPSGTSRPDHLVPGLGWLPLHRVSQASPPLISPCRNQEATLPPSSLFYAGDPPTTRHQRAAPVTLRRTEPGSKVPRPLKGQLTQ